MYANCVKHPYRCSVLKKKNDFKNERPTSNIERPTSNEKNQCRNVVYFSSFSIQHSPVSSSFYSRFDVGRSMFIFFHNSWLSAHLKHNTPFASAYWIPPSTAHPVCCPAVCIQRCIREKYNSGCSFCRDFL